VATPAAGGPQRNSDKVSVEEEERRAERYWQSRVERGGAARAAEAARRKAAEKREAAGEPPERRPAAPASDGPQRGPDKVSVEEEERRAERYWQSRIERGGAMRYWQFREAHALALADRHGADIPTMKEAMADRVPSGWRDLTLADIARELSPAYADQVKAIARLKGEIAKANKAVDYRQRDMIGHNEERDLRWQQLKWPRKALHKLGWHDRDIAAHETAARRSSYGFDRMRIKRSALAGELRMAERGAARELEKVRPQAEAMLAQRQKTAAAARATLAALQKQTVRESETEALVPERSHRRGFGFGA
jgi:hypothetical protein